MAQRRIAVIGCGFTGLCALKHFSLDPSFQVVGFEQADSIGGVWKYPAGCETNIQQPETSPFYCRIYRDLLTNVPRDLMSLEDFPFTYGEDGNSYCNSETVMGYMRSYADHFKLIPHIKFRHRVIRVMPIPGTSGKACGEGHASTQWNVTYENLENADIADDIFDAVVVCNGHYHKPNLPELPGLTDFNGEVIHSSDYRIPEVYRGKTVLIIGGSISARDIAIELLPAAKKIIICRRQPKDLFPIKLHNIQETAPIHSLTTDACILSDGSVEKIDSVIFCTGYDFNCPFIHEKCRLSIGRGRITPLYHHLINCYYPTMAFLYICRTSVFTPVLDYQVKYFKANLKGDIILPSLDEMLKEADMEYEERMKAGLREHEAHTMDDRLWPYIDQLAAELGIASYEPVCRKMYAKLKGILFGSPLSAKRYVVKKLSDEDFVVMYNITLILCKNLTLRRFLFLRDFARRRSTGFRQSSSYVNVLYKLYIIMWLFLMTLSMHTLVDSRKYNIRIGSPTINSSALPEVWGLSFCGPLMDKGLAELKKRFDGIVNISQSYLLENDRRSEVLLADDVENFVANYTFEHENSSDMIAFLGGSSRSVEQEVQMTRALKTFQISSLGNGPNQEKDRQFISISVYPLTALIAFCQRFFTDNKWTSIASIIDESSFFTVPMNRAMDEQFSMRFKSGPDIYYTRFSYDQRKGVDELRHIFKLISEVSRVVFIFGSGQRFRKIMIEAYRQNLTNGDYVFLFPILQMQGLPPALQDSYSWKYNDADDPVVFEAFRSVVLISHVIEFPEDPVPGFRLAVMEAAREKYNFTYPNNMIPSNLYPSYEMYQLFAEVLNETLQSNGSLKDGYEFAKRFLNRTFVLSTGPLFIDELGERMVDIAAAVMDPDSGNFTRSHQYSHQNRTMLTLRNVSEVWPSGIWPVLNTPRCGYRNDSCNKQDSSYMTIPVSAASSCVAVILLAFWALWAWQRWRFVESPWWQISLTDIVDLSDTGAPKTAHDHQKTYASNSVVNLSAFNSGHNNPRVSKLHNGQLMWATVVPNWRFGQKASMSWHLLQYLYELKQINSDNINEFVGICTELPQAAIFEPYCRRHSLNDLIDHMDNPDMDLKLSLLADLASGLQYIHKTKIKFHGNLRTTKCLLDSRLALKISDLGNETIMKLIAKSRIMNKYRDSRVSNANTNMEILKFLFVPPEVLRGSDRPNEHSDIYAFGIISHCLLCKTQPFGIRYEYAQSDASDALALIRERSTPSFRPKFTDREYCANLSQDAIMLFESCWEENPHHRPSAGILVQRLTKVLMFHGISELSFFGRVMARLNAYSDTLETQVQNSTKLLAVERHKCEKLLGEMFPREILRRLQDGKPVLPEYFESASVYFSSIFGFLDFVRASTPTETSAFLDGVYSYFDREIELFGVYKVETIGDIYVVVSGLPKRNGTRHITEICLMALQLKKAFGALKTRLPMQLRIGIHTGSLAAGVIGTKSPRYCLFGDAVNTASRMESHGQPSKIHLSDSAATLAEKNNFILDFRGDLEVKGKGRIATFWLTGIKEP
ncbi:atrial natriuretic peptide receptor 1-like [Paramacrobiotus metropolitanus]|uniref:atrial natriuretic peptide receptor 1-like n=1 Tax=Paramacrobiotus metropolitanus TaxID=2943436 RepID=UPI002445F15C|nr:atrial natriuretic peptide receptor 1-like [Paramacrobiotus metropolitanus]